MQPKPTIAPKKIGIEGPSMKKKAAAPALSRDELDEMHRLSSLLPPTPLNKDPTALLMNAAGYIQMLEATIRARVNNGTLPREMLSALPATAAARKPSHKRKRRSIEKKR